MIKMGEYEFKVAAGEFEDRAHKLGVYVNDEKEFETVYYALRNDENLTFAEVVKKINNILEPKGFAKLRARKESLIRVGKLVAPLLNYEFYRHPYMEKPYTCRTLDKDRIHNVLQVHRETMKRSNPKDNLFLDNVDKALERVIKELSIWPHYTIAVVECEILIKRCGRSIVEKGDRYGYMKCERELFVKVLECLDDMPESDVSEEEKVIITRLNTLSTF